MDDRQAGFLIMIGDICLGAVSADLPVTFELIDGSTVTGVPTIPILEFDEDETEATGFGNTIMVDGEQTMLLDIRRCLVAAPVP